MNADIEQAKALMLREHAAKLQADEGMTFQRAWAKALADHPELKEIHEGEALHPTDRPAFATSSGYRYAPGTHPAQKSHVDALRTILKDAGVWPAVQRIAATEKLDPQTAELVHGGPERVEAAKSERPILVYGPAISIW
jgi:hypothetical protein